jgi:hypothetical protein
MAHEHSDMDIEPADERERRVEAALALTSTPRASLWEKIRARHAAGDRVILPVEGLQSTPRRRGIPSLALSLAAAAVVTVFAVQAWRAGPDGEAKRARGTVIDPAAALFSATLSEWHEATIDSAAAITLAAEGRSVAVVYRPGEDPQSSDAQRLADNIANRLRGRGVAADRITVRAISAQEQTRAPLAPGAVWIIVQGS